METDVTDALHLRERGAFQSQQAVVREVEVGDDGRVQQIVLHSLRVLRVPERVIGDREQAELRVVLESVWMDVVKTIARQVHGKQVRDAVEGRAIQLDYARVDDGDRFQLLKTACPQRVRPEPDLAGVLDPQMSDTRYEGLIFHQLGASTDEDKMKICDGEDVLFGHP